MTRVQPGYLGSDAQIVSRVRRWPWVLLSVALLIYLVAFTRLPWPLVLLLPVLLPYGAAMFVSDLRRGEVEPFSKGLLGPFLREQEPVAFWLSIVWNAALLAGMVFITFAASQTGGAIS